MTEQTAQKTDNSLFKTAENSQAFLKAGLLGFAAAGKTFTSTWLAIGLKQYAKDDRPLLFFDTETGSDWMIPVCKKAGVELKVVKTRAFVDLLRAVDDAEKTGSVLIVDSISHVWKELIETHLTEKRKNNKWRHQKKMQFEDWAVVKPLWGGFTDRYINSRAHIIIAGAQEIVEGGEKHERTEATAERL